MSKDSYSTEKTLRAALAYIKHVGANWTERNMEHPQQWIVDALEAELRRHTGPDNEPNAAPLLNRGLKPGEVSESSLKPADAASSGPLVPPRYVSLGDDSQTEWVRWQPLETAGAVSGMESSGQAGNPADAASVGVLHAWLGTLAYSGSKGLGATLTPSECLELHRLLMRLDGSDNESVGPWKECVYKTKDAPPADAASPTWDEIDQILRGRSDIDLAEEIWLLRQRGPRVPLSPNVDGRDFYELCQTYRHARETMPHGMRNVVQAFADLQAYIKTGALPWPSYDQQDATNGRIAEHQNDKG